MELSFPLMMERGLTRRDPVPVTSWPQELVYIHSQRCPCGGSFETLGHALVPPHFERQDTTCVRCERARPFWFDISAFQDEIWSSARFEELRALFGEALEMVEREDLDGARVRFSEVAAREPWFALAWYHRGMIALIHDDLDEARECLETALGLLPLDPELHGSMADLHERRGDPIRAAVCRNNEAAIRRHLDEGEFED
ncbi:MAG TPA: tetratricopeptide repeat protein [Myxococcota bacterium]|nr:tetratricopeptide repeat protein [Myxococcota bacterium]